jgi:HD domain
MAAVPDGRIAAAGISGGRFFQADSHLRRPRSRRGRRRRHPRRRSGRGSPESGPRERLDLLEILAPLPGGLRAELVALWDEYESATSAEARLAKALDKLETIMQHNRGLNPENFDYRFNLGYGWQRRLRRGEDPGSPRGAGRELARMPRLRGNTQRGLADCGRDDDQHAWGSAQRHAGGANGTKRAAPAAQPARAGQPRCLHRVGLAQDAVADEPRRGSDGEPQRRRRAAERHLRQAARQFALCLRWTLQVGWRGAMEQKSSIRAELDVGVRLRYSRDRYSREGRMGKAFDIDFKLLPPKLWVLALDANTSKVNIAYRPRELSHKSGIQLRRQCGSFSKCPPLFNDGWRQPFKRGRQPGIGFSRIQVRGLCERHAGIHWC